MIASARRAGSLDQQIKQDSVRINDIGGLIRSAPSLQRILLNGRQAEKQFRQHILPGLEAGGIRQLKIMAMPSTSPAHAAVPAEEKKRIWLAGLTETGDE